MDSTVQNTINTLINAFDAYDSTPEVEAFKQKLIDFGNTYPDAMTFFQVYPNSGLQEEYTALISKLVMASYQPSDEPTPLPTVAEYLEQYRPSYDELCARGSIKGRAAYEALFDVSNRTDDMLEAQLIIEQERLNWKIVTEDAIEVFENKLAQMDPLFLSTTAKLLGQIAAYNHARCQEELEYLLDKQDVEDVGIIANYNLKMNIAAGLATAIMEGKVKYIRATLKYMNDYMEISLEDLFSEDISIWMLDPHNLDEYGKTKDALNPGLLEVFKSVLSGIVLK